MEEKKMTDEEIVNALDKTKQELANINPEDDDYDKLLAVKKIVDYCHYLIRRLQSENEQLRNAKTIYESVDYCADDLAKALKTIDEQKAEIERLKEKSISHYRDSWKNKFFKAQEEVERLTEELDLANETIDRNNKRYEKVSIERQKALDRVDFLEDALLDKIRRNEEIITAIKQAEQQAVKDTAKKFAALVEFHSVATRDENGFEMFSISALGLKEILHEEFGIPYDEICKEITEGKV